MASQSFSSWGQGARVKCVSYSSIFVFEMRGVKAVSPVTASFVPQTTLPNLVWPMCDKRIIMYLPFRVAQAGTGIGESWFGFSGVKILSFYLAAG